MAVLGKIRSHGVTLIIIIGIGLFAFIAEEGFPLLRVFSQ